MNRRKNILLVEDEALIALSEQNQLESYGYSVKHVASGKKAIKTILNNDINHDLILMDVDLGSEPDGTQAAEEILKIKDIPIVFLSSHTNPEIVEKTEKITSYGYVVKDSGIVVLDASIKMAFKLFDANKSLTEQKEKLHKITNELLAAQRLARLGSWFYNPQKQESSWSTGMFTILGIEEDNAKRSDSDILKYILEDDREKLMSAVEKCISEKTSGEGIIHVCRDDGNIRTVFSRCEPLFDNKENVIYLRGIILDLTDLDFLDNKKVKN